MTEDPIVLIIKTLLMNNQFAICKCSKTGVTKLKTTLNPNPFISFVSQIFMMLGSNLESELLWIIAKKADQTDSDHSRVYDENDAPC